MHLAIAHVKSSAYHTTTKDAAWIALNHHSPSNVYLLRHVSNIFEVEHHIQEKDNGGNKEHQEWHTANNLDVMLLKGRKKQTIGAVDDRTVPALHKVQC